MIPELTMEYHNNFMVINCMPIKMMVAFKILMRFITLREVVHIYDIDEEINLLFLLCKLGNTQQIDEILNSIEISDQTWIRMLELNFDAKNFLTEKRRADICVDLAEQFPQFDKETYLLFYSVPFFNKFPGYESYVRKNIYKIFPQIRIHDRKSKIYYQTNILDDKVILLNPQNYKLITKKRTENSTSSDYGSEDSSTDDENMFDPNAQIIKLPRELIGGYIINNFIVNVVDVNFGNIFIPMEIVISQYKSRVHAFFAKYDADCARLSIKNTQNYYDSVRNLALTRYLKNRTYVIPTAKDFDFSPEPESI